jgi:hypothetical protein
MGILLRLLLKVVGWMFDAVDTWTVVAALFAVTAVWWGLHVSSAPWWVFAPAAIGAFVLCTKLAGVMIHSLRRSWTNRLSLRVDSYVAFFPEAEEPSNTRLLLHGCQITNRTAAQVTLDGVLECELETAIGPKGIRFVEVSNKADLFSPALPIVIPPHGVVKTNMSFFLGPLERMIYKLPDNLAYESSHKLTLTDRVSGFAFVTGIMIFKPKRSAPDTEALPPPPAEREDHGT